MSMTIFVVVAGWDYEGFDKPLGAYDALSKAEARVAEEKDGDDRYDTIEIVKLEVQ